MVVCIAESINIMSNTIGPAMKERNPKPIQEMAKVLADSGADYLDLNIGPARKGGDELMDWLVKTVQEVSDLPLSLDTTNPVAMEAGLKAIAKGRPLINSVSLQPERLEKGIPMVTKYNADVIGLLWGKEGMPRDANERAALAVDFIFQANEAGIATSDIWIDPIATPICVDINQVLSGLEFMSMLSEIAPEAKSTVGLSNISNGVPDDLRLYLNRTYLMMLMKYGLYSAIVDAYDKELIAIAKGERPEYLKLVHNIMDGNEPDPASLDKAELEHYKTTRVLLGKVLFSNSWLTT
ncbi:MAG: dihydropteroate synthase [Desulfobacterales bacterium C00003106]|jgi:cobalamin-dependent methionine synthase I|nr:dihydropteroate synthase [Desulfobacterales bacterium]OEU56155.1 MAG: dihydropteroate synthase [Desulfobacterales bacterium C00003106]OEU58774.1 MAG: dihydropteroate synthase [Desulfobacterales bacterium C00003104]